MKKHKPVIALAQIKYFDINTRHNLQKIKYYIHLAKQKGADIICFPESCISRGVIDLQHRFLKEICGECKKNSIWGIVTENVTIKGRNYNLSILIDRNGNLKSYYKKIHLYGDKNIVSGKKPMIFKTDFARIGIAICWDLAFPELFKEMKKKGAEIIFCPSQWWYDSKSHEEKHKERELKILESLLLTRAYENICFVALCNPIMNSKFQISYTAIASPTKIVKKIVGREGLLVSRVNLNEIKKIKKIYES